MIPISITVMKVVSSQMLMKLFFKWTYIVMRWIRLTYVISIYCPLVVTSVTYRICQHTYGSTKNTFLKIFFFYIFSLPHSRRIVIQFWVFNKSRDLVRFIFASTMSSVRAPRGKIHDVIHLRPNIIFRRGSSTMEVCGSSNVTLREFGCEQSLLSRPDGSASFIQGNDTSTYLSELAWLA